jgi:hypothetical protein
MARIAEQTVFANGTHLPLRKGNENLELDTMLLFASVALTGAEPGELEKEI